MTKKFTIGFLLATLFLVVFEYIFLQEIFAAKRILIIAFSLAGILAASFVFFLFFTKYHRAMKES